MNTRMLYKIDMVFYSLQLFFPERKRCGKIKVFVRLDKQIISVLYLWGFC